MDKLKFSEWGEKLKTGGAQMGRALSGKWKEILQIPTPESKMVDEATSETMDEPNWGMNLKICSLINTDEFSGSEIVKSIKKKISGKNPITQRLSLELLEACTMNCEKVFSEVASEKVLDEMVKMIENPETEDDNRECALQLIRVWGQSNDLAYMPVFHQTYLGLKRRAVPSSSPEYDSLDPSEDYSSPDNNGGNGDHGSSDFRYGTMSVEEKKEFFDMTKTSLEVLSSMLNVKTESGEHIHDDDDVTMTVLAECKHAQLVIQMIVEGTTEDNDVLFEALHLHDDLQRAISRYEEIEAGFMSREQAQGMINARSRVESPPSSSKLEANHETKKR